MRTGRWRPGPLRRRRASPGRQRLSANLFLVEALWREERSSCQLDRSDDCCCARIFSGRPWLRRHRTGGSRITDKDLRRLAELATEQRTNFFHRGSDWRRLYSRRVLCTALCQGAALHYTGGNVGINDFDVYRSTHRIPSDPRRSAPVFLRSHSRRMTASLFRRKPASSDRGLDRSAGTHPCKRSLR